MKRTGIVAAVAIAASALIVWGVVALFGDTGSAPRTTSLSLPAQTDSESTTASAGSIDASGTVRELSEATSDPAQRDTSAASAQPQDDAVSTDPDAPNDGTSASTPGNAVAPPVIVTELTLAQRRACYWDLVAAQDRAVAEAEAAYPLDADPPDIEAHLALRASLTEEYEAAVRDEYDITAAQLAAIAEEGIQAGWPMPPLEG